MGRTGTLEMAKLGSRSAETLGEGADLPSASFSISSRITLSVA